jgi:diguanylate cyclase (GGDEF)-like protein
MKRFFNLKPRHGLVASLILFVGVTLVSYQSTARFLRGNQDIAESRARQDEITRLLGNLLEAENAQRGYLLTGNSRFAEAYKIAESNVMVQKYEVRQRPHEGNDRALFERLDELVRHILSSLQQGIDDRVKGRGKAGEVDASLAEIDSTNEISRIFFELRAHERARLDERIAAAERSAQHSFGSAVLLLIFAAVLVAVSNLVILRNFRAREAAQRQSTVDQEKTAVWAHELERTTREIGLLNDFSEGLGVAFSFEDIYETVAGHFERAIPGVHGALSVINNSQNLLETVSSWTPPLSHDKIFSPDDCRALCRGTTYIREVGSPNLSCVHVMEGKTKNYLCIPMMAQGETLGILHLDFGPARWESGQQRLATKMAESLAMKLANVKLRDTLKSQAIRDPLTGIFNRRYMEESLQRELSRAERRGMQVGVIMIDLDHFKRFNDTFGHDAGDRVLLAVASALGDSFRREDIVCRYGGEELLVIVPEMKKEEVVQRADRVRELIRQIRIQHRNEVLGGITASFGVAAYPDDARTQNELLNKADIALYSAKHAGRDCVVAYSSSIEISPPVA